MSKKRKLPDLSDCCRFCLARNVCSKEIFADWIKPKFQDLEKCADLQILDIPKYPKKICYVCLYKLEMWSNFKSQFLETNKSLSARFKNSDPTTLAVENSEVDKNATESKKKRPKINAVEPTLLSSPPSLELRDPLELLSQSPSKIRFESIPEPESTPKKIIDSIIEDFATDSTICTEASQSQTIVVSDTNSISRKITRLKNFEREAQTKRFLERKKVEMAARGEVLSESDSDNGFQLSPVQKARAKANKEQENEEEEEEDIEKQQKKISRVMKNLETNLTEKFKVNDQSIIGEDRRTRLRKGNLVEEGKDKNKNSPKKTVSENIQKSVNSKKLKSSDVKEVDVQKDINILLDKNNTVDSQKTKEKHKPFRPQYVRSEVTVNNATYVISTSLDLPETSDGKNVLSKNGINIDITSNDGRKFDIMNAVQLQRVASKESQTKSVVNNENEFNVEKCFKIKVEGMEQEDLQRVQVDLINFINQDIGKRLLQDAASSGGKITPKESMEAYKNLNQKLKEIVEKFLRQNIDDREQEKVALEALRKNRKILPEHFKAIEKSSLFQPKVHIIRLNRNLFKQYKINNLHILEEMKRQSGLVGPLSRALNKRKLVLPKKYDDFSLSSKPDPSEYARLPAKPAVKPVFVNNLSTEFSLDTTDILPVRKNVSPIQNSTSRPTILPSVPQKVADETTNFVSTLSDMSKPLPTTSVPRIVLTPTLVPKTIVSMTSIVKGSPSAMKAKKSASKTIPKITIANNKKVQATQPSSNTSQVIKGVTTTPEVVPTTSEKSKIGSKSSQIKLTTSKVSKTDPIASEKFVPQLDTNSQNDEAPITITDDDDPDASVQTSNPVSNAIMISDDDAIVILDSPSQSPLPESESVSNTKESIKPVIPKENKTAPNLTIEKTSKPLMIKNVNSTSSVIESTPSENKTITLTYSQSNLRPSTQIESTKTSVYNKTSSQESLIVSKESVTNVDALSKTNKRSSPAKSTVSSVKSSPKPVIQRQRHICGICGVELYSKEEAEAHVKNHKVEPVSAKKANNAVNSLQKSTTKNLTTKPKLMKCKRCQAIVEEANVKTHVCNSIKYNCTLCECSFGADHLLVQHMETHEQMKAKDNKKAKVNENLLSSKEDSTKMSEQEEPEEDLENVLSDKQAEGYSCFVCDKVFVDEEQMKDHLQMHCEEVSEEIVSDNIMCAFCGEKFQSEESLEEHVGKHLMENGDEKISMMINLETRRSKKNLFQCEQCSESFTSSLLLAMHLPLHEEEDEEAAMVAEYEKDIVDENVEHHVCQVCDEIFDSTEELAEHVNVHDGSTHVCILCEKSFGSIKDLQEHVSTHL